jgi:hypothetical protein
MHDSSDYTQEPSAAQQSDHGCPNCGRALAAVTRRGPTTATANPCGCSLGATTVRDLLGVTAE